MRWKAELIYRDGTRKRIETDKQRFSIGRDPGCDLVIDDPYVSRIQAWVEARDGSLCINNVGKNPALLNGSECREERLKDGDRFTIGRVDLVFQFLPGTGVSGASESSAGQTVHLPQPPEMSGKPRLLVQFASGRWRTHALSGGKILIGRDDNCDIQLRETVVSRQHAEIYHDGRCWVFRDLNSANGTYLNGKAVQQTPLPDRAALRFGSEGPLLWVELQGVSQADCRQQASLEEVAKHYFSDPAEGEAGDRTRMVRQAFRTIKKKQSKRYWGIIGIIAFLMMGSVVAAIHQYRRVQEAKAIATEIFYSIKTISLEIARIEDQLREKAETDLLAKIQNRREQLRQLETQYDSMIEELDVLGPDRTEEEKIIIRMARKFGECELTMPDEFLNAVKSYIAKWQQTRRLPRALRRALENGYVPIVHAAMAEQDLPAQFFYLALQESNFDNKAIGPKTRFGIAKGIWQFIPGTARQYGLHIGPLAGKRVFDPDDERFDFEAATWAAARFLRDLYKTDAQASALLVMASYNWGPTRIIDRIRKMPQNPKERNFWLLLQKHKIPKETYDYVFYIVSAAVIAENPKLFGFDFENPFKQVVRADQNSKRAPSVN